MQKNLPEIPMRHGDHASPRDECAQDAHEIVQLLFGKAVSLLEKAQLNENAMVRATQLTKVSAILQSLQLSLDLERGGALADNLNAFYSYMLKRLAESSRERQRVESNRVLREVKDLVCTLKEAWEAIQPSIAGRNAA